MRTGKEMIEIWALWDGESLKNPLIPSTGGKASVDRDMVDAQYVEQAIQFLEKSSPRHGCDVRLCLTRLRNFERLDGEWWTIGRKTLRESAIARQWVAYFDLCADKRFTPCALVTHFAMQLEKHMRKHPPVYEPDTEDVDDMCAAEIADLVSDTVTARHGRVLTW